MQEQAIPCCQPQEAGQEQINIGGLFDAYLSSEYFSAHYRRNTQLVFSQDIRRFLKIFNFTNQLEADKLPELIKEYETLSNSASARRTLSALKSAASWGITEGLLDGNPDVNFQPKKNGDRSPFMDFNVSPLSNKDLKKLMQAVDKNPRDKALILTVLLTRGSTDTVRRLTKESITHNANGTTTITINAFNIVMPEEAASVLLSYAQSLKPGSLFPCRREPHGPLTRQAMHVIFQKYKNGIGLQNLSHGILVKTGSNMFGIPQQQVHQPQAPQTPEP
ncbi:MAG: hypothetical protein AAB512_04970 [Patescibacteria group bacterium]